MSDERSSLEEEIKNLSHEDLCAITETSLCRLIAADPLLSDLPGDVTVDEVNAQIAVAHGQSITIKLLRHDETPLSVVIPQEGTTVLELKRSVQRAFTLHQQRTRNSTRVSWRYVWRTYHLRHLDDGQVMRADGEPVANYGVRNRSEVSFVKRLRVRNKSAHRSVGDSGGGGRK